MLKEGPYPLHLQQRVRSNRGHLANEDAAKLLKKLAGKSLNHVVLAHLSEINNLPELAMDSARKHLQEFTGCIDVVPATQGRPTPVITLP